MSKSRSSSNVGKELTSEGLLGEAGLGLVVEWASSVGDGDCCVGVRIYSKVPWACSTRQSLVECVCLMWASLWQLGVLLCVVRCDLTA